MERSSSLKKPRGISVSLSSRKSDQLEPENYNKVKITPFQCRQPVHIESKIVYQRPEIQIRNVSQQRVNFSYSNASRQNSIHQGMMLDRQISELRKQLLQKKAKMNELQHQIYKQKANNSSFFSNQRNFLSPANCLNPRANPVSSSNIQKPRSCSEQKQKSVQMQESKVWQLQEKNLEVQQKKQEKKINSEEPLNNLNQEKCKEQPIINKKISKKVDLVAREQEKQNNEKSRKQLEQRYRQLKWAQSKVLDLIRVCDEGL